MSNRTRAAAAAVLTGTLASGLLGASALTASPAHADSISASWNADATTTMHKLNKTVTFPRTQFTGTVDTATATLTGALALPPTTTSLRLGSLNLVTIGLSVVDAGPVTAPIVVDGPVWHVKASQQFRIRLTRISPLDSPSVNLVRGRTCQTGMTTASLAGNIDWTAGAQPGGPSDYTMAGSYAIPRFTGCGLLLNPLLNSVVSGPGNPLSVHFTS